MCKSWTVNLKILSETLHLQPILLPFVSRFGWYGIWYQWKAWFRICTTVSRCEESTRSCMITYISKIFTSCCGKLNHQSAKWTNQRMAYKITIKSIHFIVIGFYGISYIFYSCSLVKVLHRMLQTICSVFSLSILTFTNTPTQTSFEFGFVPFSSSNKFFQVHFPHFVFVLFQLIFYIFYFIFHFYYKYFNWIIIKTSWSTLKHFRYFLL